MIVLIFRQDPDEGKRLAESCQLVTLDFFCGMFRNSCAADTSEVL